MDFGQKSDLFAISLINPTIKLPSGIDSFEKLRNALKEDFSFTVFKNTNKRKLQLLKYIPDRQGGETSEFFSNFRQLCYNAEINDIVEQKNFLYLSLSKNHFSSESYKKMKNINSTSELIELFGKIAIDESNLIRNGSIAQLVFANTLLDTDALWNIITSGNELASYTDTNIYLRHYNSSNLLGIKYNYYKSPVTEHTKVCCSSNSNGLWKYNYSKLENYQGYLKSNDIINLSSHDFQFTINNDTFQEVVCHNERLGGNDEQN
ncbi:2467_t:CDS:2 [Funneliformis geosporum]|nr:2467_t:CDS:2 [Funneliformis geosporum]